VDCRSNRNGKERGSRKHHNKGEYFDSEDPRVCIVHSGRQPIAIPTVVTV